MSHAILGRCLYLRKIPGTLVTRVLHFYLLNVANLLNILFRLTVMR